MFFVKEQKMQEEWRDIAGYVGLYKISNQGNVWSFHRGILLKPVKDNDGYLKVCLYKKGRSQSFRVHRLVASAFIPNQENKPEVDHINTDKTDNRAINLRWTTSSENHMNHITRQNNSYAQRGRRTGKLSVFSRPVLCVDINKRFWNAREAYRILGVNWRHIGEVARGERKKAGGLSWRYLSPAEVKQMIVINNESDKSLILNKKRYFQHC